MSLIIYPAIDLRRGQVVRLVQGDPAQQTVYSDDPAGVARRWSDQGAEWLHVVNLDGVFTGESQGQDPKPRRRDLPVNLRCLAEIRAATGLPIQFGGGVRTMGDASWVFELGATRVVLGTVAVRQPEMVADAIAHFGREQIVVGIDARDGWVATHGWQETSALDVLTVARRMKDLGVRRIVYTDIGRDGTLTGVNLEATIALARESGLQVIASGGVASLQDIRALVAHQSAGVKGAIVGQALYTGVIRLAEAIVAGRRE